jgi:hypothetical protein
MNGKLKGTIKREQLEKKYTPGSLYGYGSLDGATAPDNGL